MRYGVPYKGSKNQIAEWVYSHFPKATNFYDLFAGGCAITQIALMKSEFKNYYCNDINNDGIKLFLDAINGKFENEKRWISREDFFRLKDKEPYIRYCWSFGNNGRDYLYAKEIESYKRAWHYAVYENDFSYAEKLGIDLSGIESCRGVRNRYLKSKAIFRNYYTDKYFTRCSDIEREQQLESLNRLQSLQKDYSEVVIDSDSVVFCDIPYYQTNRYGTEKDNLGFDHRKFYQWCENQKEPVLICEYYMPEDRFECIDSIEKSVLMNSGANQKAIEKIFIPKHQIELYNRKFTPYLRTIFEDFI